MALYTAFFKSPSPSRRAPLLGSGCLRESERENVENTFDLILWAPVAVKQLAKRLSLFTCRSIRAVTFSENTVIVAVVKR